MTDSTYVSDWVAGSPDLVVYQDERYGFSLPLPNGWERQGPAAGFALLAIEPLGGLPFRSTIVVTVDELPEGTDLRTWQRGIDEALPAALRHYLLLDLEAVSIGSAPAVRRLAHHVTETGHAVTVEQWVTISAGQGFTLTVTSSTLVFDELTDTFAQVAKGFRLPRSGEGGDNR